MEAWLKNLTRSNIAALQPYSTARDEYSGVVGIYLDANENPYDNGFNRYPDPHQKELKLRLAEIKGCRPEQVFVGNGSDEAIDLAFRVFCEPRIDNAVAISPTYGMYSVAAAINDVEMRQVPLNKDFSLDVPALLAATDSNTKLVMLCSPNNPTGRAIPRRQIIEIMDNFSGIVLLDEAYADFGGESMLPFLDSYPRLLILQTLSKAWAMAGLRLGLAFANPQIIALFSQVKYPYNISTATQRLVMERLSQDIASQVGQIRRERGILAARLSAMPHVLEIFPSDANFLLVRVDNPEGIYKRLVQQGIIVRDRSRVAGCEGCLRVTVGTPEENKKLLEEWKKL